MLILDSVLIIMGTVDDFHYMVVLPIESDLGVLVVKVEQEFPAGIYLLEKAGIRLY
jgi:hypothetical protein